MTTRSRLLAFASAIIVLMTCGWLGPVLADKRVAHVVGNGAYKHVQPLVSPTNDAADVSAALRELGFTIVEGKDLDEAGMRPRS